MIYYRCFTYTPATTSDKVGFWVCHYEDSNYNVLTGVSEEAAKLYWDKRDERARIAYRPTEAKCEDLRTEAYQLRNELSK